MGDKAAQPAKAPPSVPRGWGQSFWRSRARPVPFALLMAALLAARRGERVDLAPASPEAALVGVLAARGLTGEPGDVVWIDGPAGVWGAIDGGGRALVRARAGSSGEPNDLYLVEVRLSPEGALLDVGDAYDVTDTSGVDESRPALHGHLAAYTTSADGLVSGIAVVDLDGRAPGAYTDFNRVQRAQVAITNLQQSGTTHGLQHVTYALDPVARDVALAFRDDGMIDVQADTRSIVIDPRAGRAVSGESFVRVVPDERARPGNVVTWAVDRVRAVPWFGDDRMQWIKAVAFTMMDKINARFSHGTTAQEVQDELGLAASPAGPTTFTDPEVGLPPAPMKVPVSPPLPGEGQWIALDKDPFITPTPAGPASRVRHVVRAHPTCTGRTSASTSRSGTPGRSRCTWKRAPSSRCAANGEAGPGLVPRTPEVMRHMVAGFNGGFQAQHGEYGMQANGVEYLPPKPYAATVVEMRDGSTAFGAWPAALTTVPEDVLAYRQNLTALVQDGKFNPWGRNWWGGTPPGWPDNIHTTRTRHLPHGRRLRRLLLRRDISPRTSRRACSTARCEFGVAPGHEPGPRRLRVLRRRAAKASCTPLGRPLQADWEAEGKVPDMAGWVFRARRMIKGMGHMNFPPLHPARGPRLLLPHLAARAAGGSAHGGRAGHRGVAHAGSAAARLPIRPRHHVGADRSPGVETARRSRGSAHHEASGQRRIGDGHHGSDGARAARPRQG